MRLNTTRTETNRTKNLTRLSLSAIIATLASIAMWLAAVEITSAQMPTEIQQPSASVSQSSGSSILGVSPLGKALAANKDANSNYKISSRFHLQEGTTSGYLVVQVELQKGNYIYSLSQDGAVPPTTIRVVPSADFIVDGRFNPDRPAEVVENDPVFNQRLEKHRDKVQFFVPVKIRPTAELAEIKPEVMVNGQVCSEGGVCMPIRSRRVQAEFGGYFGRTVENVDSSGSTLAR